MSSRTYKVSEIVGTSPDGVDAAIKSGLERDLSLEGAMTAEKGDDQ